MGIFSDKEGSGIFAVGNTIDINLTLMHCSQLKIATR